jgi:uncharacterized protein YbjT (DUF2867 family)
VSDARIMKLIVVGASGQCGQWVVRLAQSRGYDVTAFVRPVTAYAAPHGVRTVRGEVLDPVSVAEAVAGQDAILSCLGPQRTTPINPFSPLRSPPGFGERSAANIVAAALASNIQRVCAISAAGVGDSASLLPAPMRWLLAHSTIGVMYQDLDKMERVYAASSLHWCAVRPVTLIDAQPSRRAQLVKRFGAFSVIGRPDVAQWMLDALEQPAVERPLRTPMIGWW